MPDPLVRPPRRSHAVRSADAKDRILEAAMACVAHRGVERFKLEEVGKIAGRTGGLVTYHFETKQGLLEQLVDWLFERVGPGSLAPQGSKGLGPLLRAMEGCFDRLVEQPTACRALCALQGYALSDERVAAKLAEMDRQALVVIEGHLRAGLDCSEVDGAVHARNHALVILTGLRAAVMGHLLQPQTMTVDELRLAFMGALRRSIAAAKR